ncbi:MAG TPA: 2-dehydropantoate 2-reductase [Burkholderiales bacterium]|nr:2-dehydropantoate 2-reductase [Burkholderiales bacterium]
MRICVFGAGAVGGHVAAKLAAAGHDVSVVARGAHLEAMRDKGITLIHGADTIRGKVRTSDPGLQDFVFVTLKANALGAFAEAAPRLVGRDTRVVFAQNGIPWWYGIGLSPERPAPPDLSPLDHQGKLKAVLKTSQIVGCVVYSANEVREPGVIVNNVPGNNMLVLGQADDSDSEEVLTLRKILTDADLYSPPTQDIRTSVWAKLVQNLSTAALCTLLGASVKEVRGDAALAELSRRLAAEARAIAAAHGVDPERAPTRPSGGQSSGAISHKPSMLQDYERGRPMEIEALLVAPLAFARVAGVAAPTLEAVVPLVVFKAAAKGLYN